MKHHLAQKMYKIHKMCFNCVVDYEAELRKAGLYESYERNMMQGSMKAFARDVEQWVLNTLSETNSFVTEQGDLEDWNSNTENFKKQLNSNLQEYLKHLKTHMED
jgi:L-lactate utilization protein LutB